MVLMTYVMNAGSNAEIISAGHASSWSDHTKFLQPEEKLTHQPAAWKIKADNADEALEHPSEAEEAQEDDQQQFSPHLDVAPSFIRERAVSNEERQ